MIYVTWKNDGDDEVNVLDFSTMEEAEKFVKENGLSDVADITGMKW